MVVNANEIFFSSKESLEEKNDLSQKSKPARYYYEGIEL